MLLILSVLLSLAAFELPSGHVTHGLDPSIRYAANVYDDHGLAFGRDIVHVFGPLGHITYPVAGSNHLLQAWLVAFSLRFLLLAGLLYFVLRTRRLLDASLILIGCAFFFSQQIRVHEIHVYSVCLLLILLDLRLRAHWLGFIAMLIAAFFAFVKFNMLITMVLLAAGYLGAASSLFKEPLVTTLRNILAFLAGLLVFALLHFDSISSFMLWITRSWGIAAGNSEAMSLYAHEAELVIAALMIGMFLSSGYLLLRSAGRATAISWLLLAGIPLFFEFKHGFVRGDAHVRNFLLFAPLAVGSGLVFASGRRLRWILLGTIILAFMGPAVRLRTPNPIEWATGLRFQAFGLLARAEQYEKASAERNLQRLRSGGLTDAEKTMIRGHTVDSVPHDVTFVHDTGATWRPCPFFQYFLVRNTSADLVNRRHIESPRAAEFMILRWAAPNRVHPWYWAPETYAAILENYHVLDRIDDRLLLRRIPHYRIDRVFLDATRAHWGSSIKVPHSECMVTAVFRLKPTVAGRILKALYRIPPMYVTLDSTTTYRFVPSTAPHGIVVNYLPRGLIQLEHLLRHGRVHPHARSVNSFRLWSDSSVAYFEDPIEITFYELRIRRRNTET